MKNVFDVNEFRRQQSCAMKFCDLSGWTFVKHVPSGSSNGFDFVANDNGKEIVVVFNSRKDWGKDQQFPFEDMHEIEFCFDVIAKSKMNGFIVETDVECEQFIIVKPEEVSRFDFRNVDDKRVGVFENAREKVRRFEKKPEVRTVPWGEWFSKWGRFKFDIVSKKPLVSVTFVMDPEKLHGEIEGIDF